MVKFVQEFKSKHDQENGKYVTTEGMEKFLVKFKDMRWEKGNETETLFEFYKRSIVKQKRMRFLIKGILCEMHKQAPNQGSNQTSSSGVVSEDIRRFIRPYKDRANFSLEV